MKKLQNHFTTPEQSKRMLEMGVPADSSDCYLQNESQDPLAYVNYTQHIIQPFHDKTVMFSQSEDYLPCWSVGRLIEIGLRCSTLEQRQVLFFCNGDDDYYDFMAYTINVLESGIMTNQIDFSKLED